MLLNLGIILARGPGTVPCHVGPMSRRASADVVHVGRILGPRIPACVPGFSLGAKTGRCSAEHLGCIRRPTVIEEVPKGPFLPAQQMERTEVLAVAILGMLMLYESCGIDQAESLRMR